MNRGEDKRLSTCFEVCCWLFNEHACVTETSRHAEPTQTGSIISVLTRSCLHLRFSLPTKSMQLLHTGIYHNYKHIYIASLCGGFRGAGEESVRQK